MGHILVIGGDSLVGAALVQRLRQNGREVLSTTRRPETVCSDRLFLDLAEEPDKWPIMPPIDVAVVCAAIVGYEVCSDDPAGSAKVNVSAPGALARLFAESNTTMIYLSSNAVFDGSVPFASAARPPCPTTEYGRQKSAAESLVLRSSDTNAVLRLSKILTPRNRLLRDWLRDLRAGKTIQAFSDFVIAPLELEIVTSAVLGLVESRATGIFQASGDEDISYTELALTLARTMAVDEGLVMPVSALEIGVSVERAGANTTLDMSKLEVLIGLGPPSSRETVKTVIAGAVRMSH